MNELKKYLFPSSLSVLGIILVLHASMTDQNSAYLFGAFAVLLAGLISVVAAAVQINKQLRILLSVLLTVLVSALAYADFMSIKEPIDFQKEKERRYAHVIQRLKDIRTAQLAFKAKYQRFEGNADSLVQFVKHDSIPYIKAIGEVPDTMDLDAAIKAGIASRDTSYIAVLDTIFSGTKTDDRVHPYNPDSMIYVPFTKGAKFDIQAGKIERSGVKVPVFQATDSKPFDERDPLQVGSMNDPKTNGNWE